MGENCMSLVPKPNTFSNGTTADATAVNANFDAIFNDYNGNITDANIAASGITTYAKVNGSALSSLGSISASAGAIPAANVATLNQNTTGTAANVTGTVAIANGGTGQTTAANAINALLPAQGSATGKYLTTDGSVASWGTVTIPASGLILVETKTISAANTSGNITVDTSKSYLLRFYLENGINTDMTLNTSGSWASIYCAGYSMGYGGSLTTFDSNSNLYINRSLVTGHIFGEIRVMFLTTHAGSPTKHMYVLSSSTCDTGNVTNIQMSAAATYNSFPTTMALNFGNNNYGEVKVYTYS
jgi:hypothetical protein